MSDALERLSALHYEVTVRDGGARYGAAPGCAECVGVGWPCDSRVLIDRLIEEASHGDPA